MGEIDPTELPNEFYTLRLQASDVNGRVTQVESWVEVRTEAKPGAYRRTQADLTLNLGGIDLTLDRAYDSLTSDISSSFGHGWRLANRDVQLSFNVPTTGREHLGEYNALREGTRLLSC
jgi:hypothetical protein